MIVRTGLGLSPYPINCRETALPCPTPRAGHGLALVPTVSLLGIGISTEVRQ